MTLLDYIFATALVILATVQVQRTIRAFRGAR